MLWLCSVLLCIFWFDIIIRGFFCLCFICKHLSRIIYHTNFAFPATISCWVFEFSCHDKEWTPNLLKRMEFVLLTKQIKTLTCIKTIQYVLRNKVQNISVFPLYITYTVYYSVIKLFNTFLFKTRKIMHYKLFTRQYFINITNFIWCRNAFRIWCFYSAKPMIDAPYFII